MKTMVVQGCTIEYANTDHVATMGSYVMFTDGSYVNVSSGEVFAANGAVITMKSPNTNIGNTTASNGSIAVGSIYGGSITIVNNY